MRKTEIGRDLRNASIAYRQCFLNFVDKSLVKESVRFFLAHLLRLSFHFCLLPIALDLRFRNSKREKI